MARLGCNKAVNTHLNLPLLAAKCHNQLLRLDVHNLVESLRVIQTVVRVNVQVTANHAVLAANQQTRLVDQRAAVHVVDVPQSADLQRVQQVVVA